MSSTPRPSKSFPATSAATGSCAFTLAPFPSSPSTTVIAGASRMSSVFGLKASPHTPMVFPASDPKCFVAFSTSQRFCRSFTRSTERSRSKSSPICRAIVMTARTSFGKQEPPKPTPGKRNGWPMRRSEPTPRRT